MADTIIQSLRDYFLTCPLMGDSAINVDYLPEGKIPQKIEAQSTGYLFTTGPDTGKYQIQCRLQYFQEV